MIIKVADDKSSDLATLKSLLNHPSADGIKRKQIEQEIYNIQAGICNEKEAAHEMGVFLAETKNWMVIHDLRIEHNGAVAQIDHLIINRFLEMWVCESKHFSESIEINEYGEFSAFSHGKSYGIPSPIEQNNKHILILNRIFNSKVVKLPSRLGITIKPDLKGLVLISQRAKIFRPREKIGGFDCVLKNDQLAKRLEREFEDNSPLLLAKVIGQDTLEALGKELVKLHQPIQFNWFAKFGLSSSALVSQLQQPLAAKTIQSIIAPESSHKSNQNLICYSCGIAVSFGVANYCKSSKLKFGGNIYCMTCQKDFVV